MSKPPYLVQGTLDLLLLKDHPTLSRCTVGRSPSA